MFLLVVLSLSQFVCNAQHPATYLHDVFAERKAHFAEKYDSLLLESDTYLSACHSRAAYLLDSLEQAVPKCRQVAATVARKKHATYRKYAAFIVSDQNVGPDALSGGEMLKCGYGYTRPRNMKSAIARAWWHVAYSYSTHPPRLKTRTLCSVYYSLGQDKLLAIKKGNQMPRDIRMRAR